LYAAWVGSISAQKRLIVRPWHTIPGSIGQ
jgi:hypothetical protein